VIQPKFIRKKFYNKWSYKLSLRLKGAGIFRYNDYAHVKALMISPTDTFKLYKLEQKALDNKEDVYKVADFLSKHPKESLALRIEGSTLDIYTNDSEIFELGSKEFALITWKRYQPDPQTAHLLTSERKIIGKKLAHSKYQYKVYLTPHKLTVGDATRKNFVDFIHQNTDKVLMSSAVEDWFLRTHWNWDRRYIYVDNEQTLLMLKLKCSEALGSVYEYLIIDK
jgi:hypothetical protein